MNYTKAIDVKIHLGGVPMSYLGLGKDEQQRVLIYINGELIPPKSLIIDSSNLESKDDKSHTKNFDYHNLISVNEIGKPANAFNSATGIIKTSKSSLITDTSLHYPEQLLKGKEVSSVKQYAFSTSKFIEQPTSKSVYKALTNNYDSANLFVEKNTKIINKKEGITKGNLLVHNYDIKGNLPGRGISPSKINNLLKDRIPGLLIQFKVELDKPFIEEGVNVITVVVIERGGNRHQQNVSFTVSHEPILKKPIPGIINVFNPKTNKTENATMTLNNLINHFQNNVDENDYSLKDYLASVKKGKIKKVEPLKPKLISIEKTITLPIRKKETIIVMQKNEKGDESQVGKPIYLEYLSAYERKVILIKNLLDRKLIDKNTNENGKYNKYLSEQKMRIKTESVSYQKTLSVLDNDNNKIEDVIQVSKFIKKETLEVLNDKGDPKEIKEIEYSTDNERRNELAKLNIESKLLKSKSVVTDERISISDGDGKHLKTYLKSNIPLEFKASEIYNYKPNIQQNIKTHKYIKGAFGIKRTNRQISQPQKESASNTLEIKNNPLHVNDPKELKNRIKKAKDYLTNQQNLNFKK